MRDEIKFLKELQEELKTQNTDYQATPRYWGIKNYRIVPGNEDYDDCHTSYFHNDGDHSEFVSVEDLKEFITDYYLDEIHEYLEVDGATELKELLNGEKTAFEDLWEFVIDNMNEDGHYSECPVTEESFIVTSAMFLTKAEAKRHLELNHYHYSKKAHTYAMTAWRAPKVEKLLNILKTFDWDKAESKLHKFTCKNEHAFYLDLGLPLDMNKFIKLLSDISCPVCRNKEINVHAKESEVAE